MRQLLIAVLCCWAFAAAADNTALQKLSAHLDPLKSMQAQFVQTVSDDAGKVLQTSQGTLAVQRTNHLRWETTAPFAFLIVTDGRVLWRYDRDLQQATRESFKGELADTPALIFSGDSARIGATYTVTWTQGSGGDRFRLLPRQKNALFRSLDLSFSGAEVSELTLVDNLDQRTQIRFSAVKVNPKLSDALFQFEPPTGVDVVVEP